MTSNSFGACDRLTVDDATYQIVRLDRVAGSARLPFSLKVLLENLLRNEDGPLVTAAQIEALAGWDPRRRRSSSPRPGCWGEIVSDLWRLVVSGSAACRVAAAPSRPQPRGRH